MEELKKLNITELVKEVKNLINYNSSIQETELTRDEEICITYTSSDEKNLETVLRKLVRTVANIILEFSKQMEIKNYE
jgi:hypothetical protein